MSILNKWGIFYLFSWTFVVVAGSLWLSDPDVFWHRKVGEWIVTNMAVPRTDIYSWSVYGETWTAHQWLWEALLYSVHRYTGLIRIWVLTFILGLISGLLIRGGLKLRGVSEGVATAAEGLGVLLLIGWLKPWPRPGCKPCLVHIFTSHSATGGGEKRPYMLRESLRCGLTYILRP